MAKSKKTKQRTRGFFVDQTMLPSWQVMLMSGEESKPIPYKEAYIVIPSVDVDMVRVTRRGNEIVAREPAQYRAGEPFIVPPPPAGCTYSLLNTGGTISIFQKRPIGNPTMPTKPLPVKAPENLVIMSGKDKWYLNVEVLTTQLEWLTGFKYRKNDSGQFKQDEGQLYDWGAVQPWGMDTTGVEVRTDFAFIGPKGIVDSVIYNVEKNDKGIDPIKSARAVLETLSGNLSGRSIKQGDTVHHKIFGNALRAPASAKTTLRTKGRTKKKL